MVVLEPSDYQCDLHCPSIEVPHEAAKAQKTHTSNQTRLQAHTAEKVEVIFVLTEGPSKTGSSWDIIGDPHL